MSETRTSSGFGANPISYQEIAAWAALLDTKPEPWEIRLIRRIDDVILTEISKQTERSSERGKREIDVRDIQGVSSFMSGLKARAKAKQQG